MAFLHNAVCGQFEGLLTDAHVPDIMGIEIVRQRIYHVVLSRFLSCRHGLPLQLLQSLCGLSDLFVHVLALLLHDAKLLDLRLNEGNGRLVVGFYAAQPIQGVVQVTRTLNGLGDILKEVAPVAVVQRIKKNIVGTFGTFHRPSPFVDIAFRRKESILGNIQCHVCSLQTHLEEFDSINVDGESLGELVKHRSALLACSVGVAQFFADVAQFVPGAFDASLQLVKRR